MNKWTRLQDKIASHRLLTGALLIMFSCTFLVYILQMEMGLRVYYKYRTQGIITSFEELQEGGIASHHLQYADLSGLMRYDMPMDIVDYKNHLEFRVLVIEDTDTNYAVLINNHNISGLRPAEMGSVYGYVRKMDEKTFAYFLHDFDEDLAQIRSEGWNIEPQYYINDLEKVPSPEEMRLPIIIGIVNVFLLLICVALLLVPHPKTVKEITKFE